MLTNSIQNKLERIAKHYAFHYGFDNQINKLIEECSELVTAQCQIDYLRKKRCHTAEDQTKAQELHATKISELADVLILSRQIDFLMTMPDFIREKKEIEKAMSQKLTRQLVRIGDEENEFNNQRNIDRE